jgi:hypothetical protein
MIPARAMGYTGVSNMTTFESLVPSQPCVRTVPCPHYYTEAMMGQLWHP